MKNQKTVAILAVAALGALSSYAYTFEESRTHVSTEIFGYDRAQLPRTGNALRTDAFVSIANDLTNRTFHLDDLVVLGYDREKGTAGAFRFFVVTNEVIVGRSVRLAPKKDASGRDLDFNWYDDATREAGWYDADGRERWENLEFRPGDAFCMQGNGLRLETNGIVLDNAATNAIPDFDYVAVGNCWAKRINLVDQTIDGNGTNDISGGITLQTLRPDLGSASKYAWWNKTNNVSNVSPAIGPCWFERFEECTRDRNITFDMGEAYWMQGYQSNDKETKVNCTFNIPKFELKMETER